MKKRMQLAVANFCREYLRIYRFLSDAENNKVHSRIKKWQIKNGVEITEAQLMSVEAQYDDNAKAKEE